MSFCHLPIYYYISNYRITIIQIAMTNRLQQGKASYENIKKGLPAYEGFLYNTPRQIIPKQQIKSFANCPAIGSFRYPDPNFEKKELNSNGIETYTGTLVMDKAYNFMTAVELRIEDYYLLRTAPIDSSLFKLVASSNNNSMPPFNPSLHCINSCVAIDQPNLNQHWLTTNFINQSAFIKQPPLSDHHSPFGNHQQPTDMFLPSLRGNNQPSFPVNHQPPSNSNLPNVINNNPPPHGLSNSQATLYQTPADRLSSLPRRNVNNSNDSSRPVRSLQDTSFNQNNPYNARNNPTQINPINTNQVQVQNHYIVPQVNNPSFVNTNVNNVINSQSPFDIFLRFFSKQLRQAYEKGQKITKMIEDVLNNCFLTNERIQELKNGGGSLSPELRKKRKESECNELKKLMDAFWHQIDTKINKKDNSSNVLEYSADVWKALHEIYIRRIGDLYKEMNPSATQETVRCFIEKFQEKNGRSPFHCKYIQRQHPQPISTISSLPTFTNTHDSYQTYNLPARFSNSYNDANPLTQQHIRNQVFLMNMFNSHLQGVYEKERIEKEEHLLDRNQKYEDDYYEYQAYRRKKKEDTEIIVIVRQPETNKDQSTASTNKSFTQRREDPYSPIRNSPYVSQFTASSVKAKKNQQYSTVLFMASIVWIDNSGKNLPDETYKSLKGSFMMPHPIHRENIEDFISKNMKVTFKRTIRQDAKYVFSSLKKQKGKFQITLKIQQHKLNLPPPYKFQCNYSKKDNLGVQITSLTISHPYGQVAWPCPINIQTFDFSSQSFQIGDNTIQCNVQCLNLQSKITFFSFPKEIIRMEERYYHYEIEQKMKKNVKKFPNMELIGIDWAKRKYSIASQKFFQLDHEEKKQMEMLLEKEKMELKELIERLEIHTITIKQ